MLERRVVVVLHFNSSSCRDPQEFAGSGRVAAVSVLRQFTLVAVSKRRRRNWRWIYHLALVLGGAALAMICWTLLGLGPWHLHFGVASFKDLTGGVQSLVTALGVVVGGSWAYFKFVRGRTYRPRLAVDLAGQWRKFNGSDVLQVRVRVTNIGASMVALNQYGTGLLVALPMSTVHNEMTWEYVRLKSGTGPSADDVDRVFEVLREHAWIEPGETVSDDLLLDLGCPPSLYKLELTLLWSLSGDHAGKYSADDVEVFARRVVHPDELLIDKIKQ